MPLAPGTRLGSYEILAPLGAGGMGEVWRARDSRLGREVALKVLPDAQIADPAARARLLREARSAAALNHPHILTVYEVGETDGHVYLATEYLAGRTLAEIIQPSGLPVPEALRLATQVAAGISHAHARGVIHRDIKPSNVLVTPEGDAKVLDFGIATLAPESEETRSLALTAPGALVGTPAVMAPEIWRGESADARSDVWALGALIHAMLTGKMPFAGRTSYELSAAILHSPPEALPERVPAALRAVVARCLEPERDRRYRSAAEVHAALQAIGAGETKRSGIPRAAIWVAFALLVAVAAVLGWRAFHGAPGATKITSLAVLPLENISGDPSRQYFADGMTEELITRLAQLGVVRVISRTSVMRFQRTSLPLPAIARELGVDAIVEGSVEQVGDRVRVSAQLMRAANEEHLWGRSYERQVGDALTLQDEVAGEIAQEVGGALAPVPAPGKPARSDHATGSARAAAVQAYLRGREQYQRFTAASNRRAIQYYDQALALDSTFTPAAAARASSLIFLSFSPDTVALARAAVTQALALDPHLGEAHAQYATLLFEVDWDWSGAERDFRRAIELNPNDEDAHHQYSHLLVALGRMKEARQQADIMLALDPLAPAAWNHMGFTEYEAGHLSAAGEKWEKALTLDPAYVAAFEGLLELALLQRNWSAFPSLYERMKAAGAPIDPLFVRMVEALEHGRNGDAIQAIHEIAQPSDTYPWSYTHLAEWFVLAGDRERAFALLDTAWVHHDYELTSANFDPALASLRSDPRYAALRARMHLPK